MRITSALAALALASALAAPAAAGDYNGNFMVRVLGAGVITQDSLNSLGTSTGLDLKALGFDAKVSDEFIPAATLTYFLNRNLAVELFCCFARHHVDLAAPPALAALSGKVAEMWIFPPALTLQYHFDGLGGFKPYVGVGAQYIHFFDEKTGANPIGASRVSIDDAFGVTLQAGLDIQLGHGWYANLDVKKTWLDTKATWRNAAATGSDVIAKVDLDPLIISAGIGYRFDLFGRRAEYVEPLK